MGTDSAIKPAPTTSAPSKLLLYSVCAFCAIWIIGLTVMAVGTTNLYVLNLRQIDRASLIITGIPTEIETGRISVKAVWKGATSKQNIVVDHLSRTAATKGELWIFPLLDSPLGDGHYIIAPYSESERGQDPNRPQGMLIYPGSHELEQQLKELLDSGSK